MRVLMLTLGCGKSITGSGYIGGTEYGAKRLRDSLISDGVDIFVIGNGGDFSFSSPSGFWRIWWSVISFISGVFYIATGDFDIIYARYSTYPLFIGVCLKYMFNIKLVASIHGGDIRHGGIFKTLITACLKECDTVVCYDNDEHIMELRRRGIDPTVIENGIDINMFKPINQIPDKKKIIYIGGTRIIKGFVDIITASGDRRLESLDDLELHIYGDKSIKSDRTTKFFDPIPNDKVKDIMVTGQLFVLPSYAEGVPGSLLEAMSSGMYVIASDLSFTRKILDDKFLFKAGDVDRMVELMLKFLNEKESYFGSQNIINWKIIVDNYSIDIVSKKWKKMFQSLSSD